MSSDDRRRLLRTCAGNDSTAVERIVKAWPESVREVNEDGDTCFHIAVSYGNLPVVEYLFKWLKENPRFSDVIGLKNRRGNTVLHLALGSRLVKHNPDCCDAVVKAITSSLSNTNLINVRDGDGNTALHLAIAGRKFQILESLLACDSVDVDVLCSDGTRHLDALISFLNDGTIDENTFPKVKFLASRITNTERYKTSRMNNRGRGARQANAQNILLVTTIVFAALTFHAATIYPSTIAKWTHTQNEGDMITIRSFIFYNSVCFVASVTSMVYLLHEMPLKPWPQVMVFTFYASYMFLIIAISGPEAVLVFFLSIPLLLSAAAGKLFQFTV